MLFHKSSINLEAKCKMVSTIVVNDCEKNFFFCIISYHKKMLNNFKSKYFSNKYFFGGAGLHFMPQYILFFLIAPNFTV